MKVDMLLKYFLKGQSVFSNSVMKKMGSVDTIEINDSYIICHKLSHK